MGHVYIAGGINSTEYFNTVKEANRHKPGGDEPESVVRVDAASECNRLERVVRSKDRDVRKLRLLLRELYFACSLGVQSETEIGRRVGEYFRDNPFPPAGDGNRDGQRSYGV